MSQQPVRQFRILAFAGGMISLVGSAVVAIGVVITSQSGDTPQFVEPFAAFAIIGLIVSTIALMFAWKSKRAFWDCPVAYAIATVGVALPALLVIAKFLTIIQRLVG